MFKKKHNEFTVHWDAVRGLPPTDKALLQTMAAAGAHAIFYGAPGLGKTTVAMAYVKSVLESTGGKAALLHCSTINSTVLIDAVLKYKAVLLDDVHMANPAIQAALNSLVLPKGSQFVQYNRKAVKVDSVIVTTSNEPLAESTMQRFPLKYWFRPYVDEQIRDVIAYWAQQLDIPITDEMLDQAVVLARGTPRIAVDILKQMSATNMKSLGGMLLIARGMGINRWGLTDKEVLYLHYLNEFTAGEGREAIGVTPLDAVLPFKAKEVEPFLLYRGLINITSKGRQLSVEGLHVLSEIEELKNA